MKIAITITILFILINSCSLNKNSKFWSQNSSNFKNSKISNEINDNSFELTKQQIIEYGKNKDFPDINN